LTILTVRFTVIPDRRHATSTTRVAITIDEKTLIRLDRMVAARKFPSRSRTMQDVVEEKLNRMEKGRLARECCKLDVEFERAIAEGGKVQPMDAAFDEARKTLKESDR